MKKIEKKKKLESQAAASEMDNTTEIQPPEDLTNTEEEKSMEKIQEELKQMEEVAKRAMADLQNFKRRVEEDRKQFIHFATSALLLELLLIADNLSRAVKNIPAELNNHQWIQGIIQIQQQMQTFLLKQGLTEIPTIGQKFDPYKHEALMQGLGEKDIIIEEFEKGYMLGDRILRPAKVKIGQGENNSNT